jgi:hypothetical protein
MMLTHEEILEKYQKEIENQDIEKRPPPFFILVFEQLEVFNCAMDEVGIEPEKQAQILKLCADYYDKKPSSWDFLGK